MTPRRSKSEGGPAPQKQAPKKQAKGKRTPEEAAQRTLEQAAAEATFKDMDGRRVMANEGGQSFLDTMQVVMGEQPALREEHGREISKLKIRMGRMEKLGCFCMDVRERAFLAYLRDKWRQPEVTNLVRSLNRSIVHSRYAEADALMFYERRPTEELRQFVYLYGFPPKQP